ncbi:hypothetical protein Ahy_A03g010110 isoform E [Arachis hypogaea]|uniref:Uncharacterized protein n=1 Tax=Arachis hypogaea TaxID=3818 RepID=A0A445DL31_ARAHY|nr:hypothetical protein Ahy_A03g010110 isoform E [Arachis hypogaea]
MVETSNWFCTLWKVPKSVSLQNNVLEHVLMEKQFEQETMSHFSLYADSCTAKSRKRKIEHESFIKKKICCYPAQGSTRMQEEWGIIDAVP